MWTLELDKALLDLWESHSAEQIGTRLGRTRNAVIGRYYRLIKRKFPSDVRREQRKRDKSQRRAEKKLARNLAALALMHRAMSGGASRNQAIRMARKNGATLQAIAADLGISRERIRQLVANPI